MSEPDKFAVQTHWTVWMIGFSLMPGDFSLHIGPFTFFWLRDPVPPLERE